MALEYQNRMEHISNQAGGLQSFIVRETVTVYQVVALKKEVKELKASSDRARVEELEKSLTLSQKEVSDLKKLQATEQKKSIALTARVVELEKERDDLLVQWKASEVAANEAEDALKVAKKHAKEREQMFSSEAATWKAKEAELKARID